MARGGSSSCPVLSRMTKNRFINCLPLCPRTNHCPLVATVAWSMLYNHDESFLVTLSSSQCSIGCKALPAIFVLICPSVRVFLMFSFHVLLVVLTVAPISSRTCMAVQWDSWLAKSWPWRQVNRMSNHKTTLSTPHLHWPPYQACWSSPRPTVHRPSPLTPHPQTIH